ncbi:MAG: hypothetical protein ACK53L_10065, partial [Pirellulaceae bacterium]
MLETTFNVLRPSNRERAFVTAAFLRIYNQAFGDFSQDCRRDDSSQKLLASPCARGERNHAWQALGHFQFTQLLIVKN